MGIGRGRHHLARLGIGEGAGLHEHAAAGDGLAVLEVGGKRRLKDGDRFRRHALDVNAALAVGLEVGGAHLELLGRDVEQHGPRLLRRHDDGVADPVRAAAGEGAHAVRPGVGVGGVDDHHLRRYADRFGTDLGHHRSEPLAEIGRGQRNDEIAGGGGMDQRLARIAAEIHAGRVVDRGDAAPARLHGWCLTSWRGCGWCLRSTLSCLDAAPTLPSPRRKPGSIANGAARRLSSTEADPPVIDSGFRRNDGDGVGKRQSAKTKEVAADPEPGQPITPPPSSTMPPPRRRPAASARGSPPLASSRPAPRPWSPRHGPSCRRRGRR